MPTKHSLLSWNYEEDKMDIDTKTNKTDIGVIITKGAIGAIPLVGPLVAEAVGSIIPNQKIDRLESFLKKLDERVQDIEKSILEETFKKPEFLDVFEEGLLHASRALSEERKEYIASLIKNSITDEQAEYLEHKMILSLIGELNDIQIILLQSYLERYQHDNDYYEHHKSILAPLPVHMGSSQEEFDKKAIRDSYKAHLVRMGLLQERFKKLRKGELPDFDEKTGMMKAQGHQITPLGRLVLRFIDLADKDDF